MIVFRLTRKKYGLLLSGKGAAITGNRWNSKGVEMIYTAESRALALAEVVVHLSASNMPKDYYMLEIELPKGCEIKQLDAEDLPDLWNLWPHLESTQKIGDQFVIDQKALVLKIPSAVVPGDFNILINPYHPQFSKVTIKNAVPFFVDDRFVTK